MFDYINYMFSLKCKRCWIWQCTRDWFPSSSKAGCHGKKTPASQTEISSLKETSNNPLTVYFINGLTLLQVHSRIVEDHSLSYSPQICVASFGHLHAKPTRRLYPASIFILFILCLTEVVIGKRKTFRGVFFVGPDKRKFDRSCLKTPETKRSGVCLFLFSFLLSLV